MSTLSTVEWNGVTVLAGFWEASLSPVLPCLKTLNLCNLLFSVLLGVFSVSFFFTIFGPAMSRQAKKNVCDAQSIPVRLQCPFENCHKSYNSKKHKWIEHFLSTAMDRHVLNSKTTPQAAPGCGIPRKIFWQRPFHDVTRSPGNDP